MRAIAHLEICCPLTGRFPVRQQGEVLSAYREIQLSLDNRGGDQLMSGDQPVGSLRSTDEVSALIEELQFTPW